jgi:hypothetical protein
MDWFFIVLIFLLCVSLVWLLGLTIYTWIIVQRGRKDILRLTELVYKNTDIGEVFYDIETHDQVVITNKFDEGGCRKFFEYKIVKTDEIYKLDIPHFSLKYLDRNMKYI